MTNFAGLNLGLGSIPLLKKAETRSICAENPDGSRGGGGKVENHLGPKWKGRPCIDIEEGKTQVLADIKGPGIVQHIWITVPDDAGRGKTVLRDLVLRMYWDGQDSPSVEVPLGDFFASGFARRARVDSMPICVNPTGGFNSYWPMPFRKHAKITVENQYGANVGGFFYQITYSLCEVPEDAAFFHAQWRREDTTSRDRHYTILEGVQGRGQYVGTYLAWTQLSEGWWGEGEILVYLDGDTDYPTIIGTGTEDYMGGAWCFGTTYSTAFLGYPYAQTDSDTKKHGLYRWHIMDPIRFEKEITVRIQALGWMKGKLWPLQDDICSVAYWYQTLPHRKFPALLPANERWPR